MNEYVKIQQTEFLQCLYLLLNTDLEIRLTLFYPITMIARNRSRNKGERVNRVKSEARE